MGADTILDDFTFPERDAFISLYPQGYCNVDKMVRAPPLQHLFSQPGFSMCPHGDHVLLAGAVPSFAAHEGPQYTRSVASNGMRCPSRAEGP